MNTSLTRRTFLRTTSATLALPLLESLLPRGAFAAAASGPRRMVCICTTLGINAENIFPKKTGRGYALTPYLEPLRELRESFTLFSGVAHPEVDGGHSSEVTFLSAAPHPKSPGFKNSISLDQFLLEKQPATTRYPNLNLTTSNLQESLSVSRTGVMLPADDKPSVVFRRLFINGTPAEVAEQTHRLAEGRSIMDLMGEEARRLQRRVSAHDGERLEEYFTSVREVEQRLHKSQQWAAQPKPKVAATPPVDIPGTADFAGQTRLMFDLMQLALENDSTRVITFRIQGQQAVPPLPGVKEGWHNLSHHGKDPEKLEQLHVIELEQMKLLAGFLAKLKATQESGASLLDRTSVLYGSNLGNASSHDTMNLPVMLAGGGFQHGQYLAYDPKDNEPLCNLYVAMLRQHGIDAGKFASSKATTLPGFQTA
ncbi:MAG: DUF1552 domain-containing protein [Limisphaerales bacterium]